MSRRLHPSLNILAWATVGFLYLPLLAVALYSFNASRGMLWGGFSYEWYERLFVYHADSRIDVTQLLVATRNTLILATVSTLIATILGTAVALGLRTALPRWLHYSATGLVMLPVAAPDIILAATMVAMRQGFGLLDVGMAAMVVGHVTFQISFVILVVQARLAQIGNTQEEAARDLYASSGDVLRRILLPQLFSAIAAGAMLAFTLSLDDFVISFFTASPASATLPLIIQAAIKRGVAPEIHALSTLVLFVTVLFVIALSRFYQPHLPTHGS